MSNLARVKVEVNPKDEDREIAFRKLMTNFRNACKDVGIMHAYKQHEHYESESRKKRRKLRENEIGRIKNKLKENFLQQGNKK